jgi:hypothetical protein
VAARPARPARHDRPAAGPPRRVHRRLQHRTPAPVAAPAGHPATAYNARPKAVPGDRSADAHDRVRHDKISKTGNVSLRTGGRLHHIGIGRTYAGTHVLLLVQDLNIRILNAATGELLRELTLDPTRDYQPTGRPPGPAKKQPRT